jgi:hypothetical protein
MRITSRPLPRTLVVALLACLGLAACGDGGNAPQGSAGQDQGQQPETVIGKAVKQATDQARKELATGNITLDAGLGPKAEITPQGDLLIDGTAVALEPAQRALMQEYRGHIVKVAEAGIGIGLEGADLAGKAVGEALKGVFTGNTEQIEQKIEAEAEGIKQSAQKLCALLPPMLETQNRLAEALPAFKPYATMTQTDIDDCVKDGKLHLPGGVQMNADIDIGGGQNSDAAAEAEAASAEAAPAAAKP